MSENNYLSNLEYQSNQSEKLFQILENLQSIIETAKMQDNTDQFVLGVEASMDMVRGAISGKTNPNQVSICYPE